MKGLAYFVSPNLCNRQVEQKFKEKKKAHNGKEFAQSHIANKKKKTKELFIILQNKDKVSLHFRNLQIVHLKLENIW